MRPCHVAFALLAGAAIARPLAGQASAFRPHPSPLYSVALTEAALPAADTLNLPKTYWKEGALMVGIPTAMLGAYGGYGLCGMDESSDPPNCALAAVGGALVGGLIGATTGALIGGLFLKPTS